MRKKIALLLFLVGMLLFSTPFIKNSMYEHKQKILLTNWDQSSSQKQQTSSSNSATAVLEIKKINLKMPILEDATPEHLNQSIATITHHQQPGKGNYSIAGHRSFTYGKQFNRLNELEKGDIILLKTKEKTYPYTVSQKFLVKPTDQSVLETKKSTPEITLVTCDPPKNPTHRLIVKGTLQR